MTADEAVNNAARVLAEQNSNAANLALMERLEKLAETWVGIAQILVERERA